MINDTKFSGSMSNESKNINNTYSSDGKFGEEFIATELLDFLMTEDDNFLVTGKGRITQDIKYG